MRLPNSFGGLYSYKRPVTKCIHTKAAYQSLPIAAIYVTQPGKLAKREVVSISGFIHVTSPL